MPVQSFDFILITRLLRNVRKTRTRTRMVRLPTRKCSARGTGQPRPIHRPWRRRWRTWAPSIGVKGNTRLQRPWRTAPSDQEKTRRTTARGAKAKGGPPPRGEEAGVGAPGLTPWARAGTAVAGPESHSTKLVIPDPMQMRIRQEASKPRYSTP